MDLQAIWFFLWGLLWAVFFMTDGFDFGVGTLFPFLGKTDEEKQTMIAAIGPLWDGNEVWLISAGGVTFAAFPLVYSVMFSTLYSALMLILFTLILRGVSFEFRNKVDDPRWKRLWDACIFIGSLGPALLFGVAFANIFQGIPFDGKGIYHGTLLTLLNPYGLLGGVLFVLLFLEHGALWLGIKTDGALQARATRLAAMVWPILVAAAVTFLVASWFKTNLYANYLAHPVLFAVIAVTVLALLTVRVFIARQAWFKAWFASSLTIVGAIFYRCDRAVSQPVSLQSGSRFQSDRPQCQFQSVDPEDHACGGDYFCADRDRLSDLVLQFVQAQGRAGGSGA